MEKLLKVLILEDNLNDAEIIRNVIENAGMNCSFCLAINKDNFLQSITSFCPDVVLSDNSLPQFDSEEALQIVQQLLPHIPFILVTGTVSEEYAAKITKSGADDYILKDRLARLPAAIETALHHRQAEIALTRASADKEMLAGRMAAILNTIPAKIALLDSHGYIVDVNEAWKRFADENGYSGMDYEIGANYIEVSKNSIGKEKKDGETVAKGITAVLVHELKEFVFEYPCHTVQIQRWFRMIVTPLSHKAYPGAVIMHIDITEVKKMEQERIDNKTIEQKKITRAILQAQEKERNVMGRELHDNVNQILAGTKLILSTAQIYPGKREDVIKNAIANVQYAIDENRKIAHELVAPDFRDIKITEQLISLTEVMLKKAGINVQVNTKELKEELLDDEQKLTIYRVAQEQCTNIIKHAGATAVVISLAIADNMFEMSIADNGKGMEKGMLVKGIGCNNIRSRLELFNGVVHMETAPGKGFTLEIGMPIHHDTVEHKTMRKMTK